MAKHLRSIVIDSHYSQPLSTLETFCLIAISLMFMYLSRSSFPVEVLCFEDSFEHDKK